MVACRSPRQKELPIRGIGSRRRKRRGALQLNRHSQAERDRSGGLPAERPVEDRRTSHQPHRGAAAMERRSGKCGKLISRRLDRLQDRQQQTLKKVNAAVKTQLSQEVV